jgi:adenine phosphoribosyltransferase
MCRKAGKLPPPTARHEYKTEYSEDVLEMKIGTGSVVVVDDVLATGGTLQAVNDLCQTAGYTVIDNLVFIDLLYVQRTFNMMVDGAKEFDLEVKSLIQYE